MAALPVTFHVGLLAVAGVAAVPAAGLAPAARTGDLGGRVATRGSGVPAALRLVPVSGVDTAPPLLVIFLPKLLLGVAAGVAPVCLSAEPLGWARGGVRTSDWWGGLRESNTRFFCGDGWVGVGTGGGTRVRER